MRPPVALSALALGAVVLLAACGSGSSDAASTTPLASATAAGSAAASVGVGQPPSAELVTWAGQVCTATKDLEASVAGIGTAITAGGTDVGASLTKQFDVIKTSAASLSTTAQAIPADAANGPEALAVKDSAASAQTAIDALGQSISDLTNSSGIGAVTALAGVGSAAKDAATALGDTATVISTAIGDGSGTLGQAFKANPTCADVVPKQ